MHFCFAFSGKVSIRKDDLYKYKGKEHWFSLQPVDPNSEVQVNAFQDVLLYEAFHHGCVTFVMWLVLIAKLLLFCFCFMSSF